MSIGFPSPQYNPAATASHSRQRKNTALSHRFRGEDKPSPEMTPEAKTPDGPQTTAPEAPQPEKKRMGWLKKLSLGTLLVLTGAGGIVGGGKVYMDHHAAIKQVEAKVKADAASQKQDIARRIELLDRMFPLLNNNQDKYEILQEMLKTPYRSPELRSRVASATQGFTEVEGDNYRNNILLSLAWDPDPHVNEAVISSLNGVQDEKKLGKLLHISMLVNGNNGRVSDTLVTEIARIKDNDLKQKMVYALVEQINDVKSKKSYYYSSWRTSEKVVSIVTSLPNEQERAKLYKMLIALQDSDMMGNIAEQAAKLKDDKIKVEILSSLMQHSSDWRVRNTTLKSLETIQDEGLKAQLLLSLVEKK